ncbi:MAG: hypothetical protein VX924_03385, partial [Candidatus Neomarinimicrobiota bacterium]|nr:hypothetical protein [Candidatus Neomarinimicrobiota bacterium]
QNTIKSLNRKTKTLVFLYGVDGTATKKLKNKLKIKQKRQLGLYLLMKTLKIFPVYTQVDQQNMKLSLQKLINQFDG